MKKFVMIFLVIVSIVTIYYFKSIKSFIIYDLAEMYYNEYEVVRNIDNNISSDNITAHPLLETSDGGFLVGYKASEYIFEDRYFSESGEKTYLVKYDRNMKKEWSTEIESSFKGKFFEKDNKEIVCIGQVEFSKAMYALISPSGEFITYKEYENIHINDYIITDDNEFLVVGFNYDKDQSNRTGFLSNIDKNGNILWSKTFDKSKGISKIKKIENNNYVLIGLDTVGLDSEYQSLIFSRDEQPGINFFEIDSEGNILNKNGYIIKPLVSSLLEDDSSFYIGSSNKLIYTDNGNTILIGSGYEMEKNNGLSAVYAICFNSNYELMWEKMFHINEEYGLNKFSTSEWINKNDNSSYYEFVGENSIKSLPKADNRSYEQMPYIQLEPNTNYIFSATNNDVKPMQIIDQQSGDILLYMERKNICFPFTTKNSGKIYIKFNPYEETESILENIKIEKGDFSSGEELKINSVDYKSETGITVTAFSRYIQEFSVILNFDESGNLGWQDVVYWNFDDEDNHKNEYSVYTGGIIDSNLGGKIIYGGHQNSYSSAFKIIRYDSDGNIIFSKAFRDFIFDRDKYAIKEDREGNILIACKMDSDYRNIVLLKINKQGKVKWVKRSRDYNKDNIIFDSFVIDDNNEVWLFGTYISEKDTNDKNVYPYYENAVVGKVIKKD